MMSFYIKLLYFPRFISVIMVYDSEFTAVISQYFTVKLKVKSRHCGLIRYSYILHRSFKVHIYPVSLHKLLKLFSSPLLSLRWAWCST